MSNIKAVSGYLLEGHFYHKRKDALLAENPTCHICPACDGEGKVYKMVDTYPTNLPDSGWVSRPETFDVICKLCNGKGRDSKTT